MASSVRSENIILSCGTKRLRGASKLNAHLTQYSVANYFTFLHTLKGMSVLFLSIGRFSLNYWYNCLNRKPSFRVKLMRWVSSLLRSENSSDSATFCILRPKSPVLLLLNGEQNKQTKKYTCILHSCTFHNFTTNKETLQHCKKIEKLGKKAT